MITIILGGFALAVAIQLLKEFIKGFIEGWKENDKSAEVKKEALVPKEAHEEITSESLMKDMSDRWDKDVAGAGAELAQHTDVLDDTPVITQDAPEEPSQQAEMAENEFEDADNIIPVEPDVPGYHDYWMSHERTGMIFEADYTVVDIETMGFDFYKDKIVEISAVRVRNHEVVDHFQGFNKKSKLGKFLKENSPITTVDIIGGTSPEQLLQDFLDFLGDDPMVGHNLGFDLNFLRYNLHYYGFGDLTNEFIDTMLIGKHYANPSWRHHRVDDYIAHYPKEVGFDKLSQHSAYNDALIEQRIYEVERDILADDFKGEITPNMFWALPKVKVVETEAEIVNRTFDKKMTDAIRVAIDDKDYTYSNQLINELFEDGVTDHSKLYKRMAMNYKRMADSKNMLNTIIKWQSNMGGSISRTDAKWIQSQMELIDKQANKLNV